MILSLFKRFAQRPSRTGAKRFVSIWIMKRNQKERNVLLPWNPAIRVQVYPSQDISISIILVRDEEFAGVYRVMYIPSTMISVEREVVKAEREVGYSQDDAAEAKAIGLDCAEELGFRLG